MQNISTYFKQPTKLCLALLTHFGTWLPDALYLKIMFRLKMGYSLDLKSPKTFDEKLQWLKLYNRKPEYTQMVDKYEVKKLVEKILGKEYVIPTLGVWDHFDDIDFSTLPDRFVLKTTNGGGGGGVVICRDKNTLDIKSASERLNHSLKASIYKHLKEWPYKNVKQRSLRLTEAENCATISSIALMESLKSFWWQVKDSLVTAHISITLIWTGNICRSHRADRIIQ